MGVDYTYLNKLVDYLKLYEEWGIAVIPLYPSTKQPCVKWKIYENQGVPKKMIQKWLKTFWNPEFWHKLWYEFEKLDEKELEIRSEWIKALEEEYKKLLEHGFPEEVAKRVHPDYYKYQGELNLAVLGGKASKGLVLVDVEDFTKIAADPVRYLEALDTTVVKTGKENGYHIWYRCKDYDETTRKPNGEIRCTGAYVVAPPSMHPSGCVYEFLFKKPPSEATKAFIKDICLDWISRTDKKEEEKAEDKTEKETKSPEEKVKEKAKEGEKIVEEVEFEEFDEQKFLDAMSEIPVIEGIRSVWVFVATYYFKLRGYSPEQAFEKIIAIPVCASKILRDNKWDRQRGYEWWLKYEWNDIENPTLAGLIGAIEAAEEESKSRIKDLVKEGVLDKEIEIKLKYRPAIKRRFRIVDENCIRIPLIFKDKQFGILKIEIADSKHYLVSIYKPNDPPELILVPTKVKKDFLYMQGVRDKIFKFIKEELDDSEYSQFLRHVQYQFNRKIVFLERKKEEEKEKKEDTPEGFNVEEALKSPTLFQDIYESLGKIIVGNPTVRKNVVYDLAAIGAPKIVLGNPNKPIRTIRSHSAVWVVGPAESGKSTLLKLIYEIAPKAHWITRITEAALDRGFAEKIDNGVLIIPEGDIIYRTTKVEQQEGDITKKIIIPAENVVAVQLRMVIEDNMLCLVSTEKGEDGFYTVEEMIPVHPTVFIGSTSEPEEEQLRTRFKIYKMEKSAALSLEVMKRVIDGLLWKEQPGKYHPDELKVIYHAIYDRVSKLKAVAIPKEFEEDLMKIAMRLCTLFVPKGEFTVKITEYDEETGEEKEREILLTRDELVEKIMKGEIKYEEMLTILEQIDSDERLNRRFEDIIRRIVASACLHIAQRKVENDVLYVDKQDIEAGYDLLEDIEKEFAPKPSLTELILEVLKEQYRKDKTKWLDANEVAEFVFKRLNEEVTKSRVDKVRRLLKYLVDKGRISRRKSGNKYVYIYKSESDNNHDDWSLDSLLNE